jgi:hypothetical protein
MWMGSLKKYGYLKISKDYQPGEPTVGVTVGISTGLEKILYYINRILGCYSWKRFNTSTVNNNKKSVCWFSKDQHI